MLRQNTINVRVSAIIGEYAPGCAEFIDTYKSENMYIELSEFGKYTLTELNTVIKARFMVTHSFRSIIKIISITGIYNQAYDTLDPKHDYSEDYGCDLYGEPNAEYCPYKTTCTQADCYYK